MLCQQCQTTPFKYTCPKCAYKTCSADCVKAHKEQFECSGKRDRTEFVDIQSFNDAIIRKDFSMLEEIERNTESAQRFVKEIGTMKVPNHQSQNQNQRKKRRKQQNQHQPAYVMPKLPHHVHLLLKSAKERGVNLRLMPKGMKRRTENTSRYDSKEKVLKWRIEWKFPAVPSVSSSADQAMTPFTDTAVSETLTIQDAISKYLEPSPENVQERHRLRPYMEACRRAYCTTNSATVPSSTPSDYRLSQGGIQALRFFYEHPFQQKGKKVYVELCAKSTLKDSLRGQTIIEFPTLYVDIDPSYTPERCMSSLYPPLLSRQENLQQKQRRPETTSATHVSSSEVNDDIDAADGEDAAGDKKEEESDTCIVSEQEECVYETDVATGEKAGCQVETKRRANDSSNEQKEESVPKSEN